MIRIVRRLSPVVDAIFIAHDLENFVMLNYLSIGTIAIALALTANQPPLLADSKPDDSEASRLELKTERVCVFKDGYCLVLKQGTATTDEDGFVFTEEVPDSAVLGSFWAVPDEGKLKSMTAGWVDSKSKSTRTEICTKVIEVIKANIGKSCKFTRNEDETVEGTIVKVLEPNPPTFDDPFGNAVAHRQSHFTVSHLSHDLGNGHQVVEQTTASHFVLATDSGDMLVKASEVRNLLIRDMNSELSKTVLNFDRQKRLKMQFAKPNSKVNLSIMYFRPGVRWIPTYRVDLAESKNEPKADKRKSAELILQGEILNEAEDLIDVPFSLVVGVPNFRFKAVPSPLTLEASLRNLLAQAAPLLGNQINYNAFSNSMFTQRSAEVRGRQASGTTEQTIVDLPDELTTSSGNDLFVYEIDSMTLKNGERATVPILRTQVEYRDLYTWDVNVKHTESHVKNGNTSASPLVLSENRVWRQIELINNTEIPWTTGAAMFVDGFQPIAQELLTYTSPGGICRVPVTVAVDLRGKVVNQETDREPKALQWQGRNYARIDGKIDVELANNKTVKLPIEVQLRLGGKAKTASNEGTIRVEGFRSSDWGGGRREPINNSSVIIWRTEIEPGEKFNSTVTYDFMLRH